MDIAIPVAPLGVLTLLGFFAPYAIGALNGALPFVKTAWQKKIVSVTVALVLAAIVMVFYYAITKEPITDWWVFALIAIGIVSTSYTLVTRNSANAVEVSADPTMTESTARLIARDQTVVEAARVAVEDALRERGAGQTLRQTNHYAHEDPHVARTTAEQMNRELGSN